MDTQGGMRWDRHAADNQNKKWRFNETEGGKRSRKSSKARIRLVRLVKIGREP